jgi:hypothetical protein
MEASAMKDKQSPRNKQQGNSKATSRSTPKASQMYSTFHYHPTKRQLFYRQLITLGLQALAVLLKYVTRGILKLLRTCLDATTTLEVSNSQPSPDEEQQKQNYYGDPDLWWWILK